MRLDSGLGLIPVLMALSGTAVGGAHDDIVVAAREDRTDEVVSYLRQGMDPDTSDVAGTTLLMTAAANGNMRLVETLLRLHANLLKNNKYGESALALAALNGHQDVVSVLVESGAGINASGWSALHYAVFSGHADIVRFLVDRGADINSRAPNHHTALMLAARNGHAEIVRVLLAAGANPNVGDLEGNTALGIALKADNQEIVGLLTRHALAGR